MELLENWNEPENFAYTQKLYFHKQSCACLDLKPIMNWREVVEVKQLSEPEFTDQHWQWSPGTIITFTSTSSVAPKQPQFKQIDLN